MRYISLTGRFFPFVWAESHLNILKWIRLTLIGKFLGKFWGRFTGKLIQTKSYISYMVSVKKFEWMSFPVKRSVHPPELKKKLNRSRFWTGGFSSKTACVTPQNWNFRKNSGCVFHDLPIRVKKLQVSVSFELCGKYLASTVRFQIHFLFYSRIYIWKSESSFGTTNI